MILLASLDTNEGLIRKPGYGSISYNEELLVFTGTPSTKIYWECNVNDLNKSPEGKVGQKPPGLILRAPMELILCFERFFLLPSLSTGPALPPLWSSL